MYTVDFDKPIHVHFIGIGGISMSGLAEILLKEDFRISGSDAKSSNLTAHLEEMGAQIHYPQMASNITDDIDLVVYTAAIHPDNPEFACAAEKQIPMLTRAQLLGQIMRNYEPPSLYPVHTEKPQPLPLLPIYLWPAIVILPYPWAVFFRQSMETYVLVSLKHSLRKPVNIRTAF